MLLLTLAYGLLWLLRFLVGASVYSFLNVVVSRVPRGESLVAGRSHCTACGRVLTAWELVPCFSFLALRGRCHGCGSKIPVRDFWVEVLGGCLALACARTWGGETARAALLFLALSVLTVVALVDWDTLEIWDTCCLLLALCGLAAGVLFPDMGWPSRLLGAGIVSVPMLILALLIPGGFGGGDIKLMAAAGLLLGAANTVCAAFLAVLSGGLYGGVLLARRKIGRKEHFAFGPFLCAGIALALFFGEELTGWYLGLLG